MLAHAVTDIKNTLRRLALADTLHPVLRHGPEVVVDVGGGDHLNTVAVGLNISPVLSEVGVSGNSDGSE